MACLGKCIRTLEKKHVFCSYRMLYSTNVSKVKIFDRVVQIFCLCWFFLWGVSINCWEMNFKCDFLEWLDSHFNSVNLCFVCFEPLLSSTNTFIIVFLDEFFFYHHETFLLMSGNAFVLLSILPDINIPSIVFI